MHTPMFFFPVDLSYITTKLRIYLLMGSRDQGHFVSQDELMTFQSFL